MIGARDILGKAQKILRKDVRSYSHQRKHLERAYSKWELIKSHLPEEAGSLLDLGCNEGLFTREAARKGWCAWGIDILEQTIEYASRAARKEGLTNVFFTVGSLTPENAECLPKFDVIILASVFHEIYAAFGRKNAHEMFRSILNACNKKLFLECSSLNIKYGEGNRIFEKDNDLACIEKWVRKLVPKSSGWKVKFIGQTEYTYKEPYRYMFLFVRE